MLLTDPREADLEPEIYDCATCEYREQREAFTTADIRAQEMYRELSRPVVQDLGLVPLVFDLLRIRMSPAESEELLDRLDAIHYYARRSATPESGEHDASAESDPDAPADPREYSE